MDRRSRSLQARLDDIRRRFRAMRTVSNTASSEISGGETVIDEDGSLIFKDGGRLTLGGSAIVGADGSPLIDENGNLTVDSLTVYGDILSAEDYLLQREAIDITVVDTLSVESIDITEPLEFPDWASSALVTYYIEVSTRIRSPESNNVMIKLNGKPVSRPRSDTLGNVSTVVAISRGMVPETPNVHVEVEINDDIFPTSTSKMLVTIGGVFTA